MITDVKRQKSLKVREVITKPINRANYWDFKKRDREEMEIKVMVIAVQIQLSR